MTIFKKLAYLGLVGAVCLSVSPAFAVEEITVVIKDHKFEPATVEVPAGTKIKLIIDNQDPTPEEFESHELKREKVIQGNSQGIVMIGPLEEGSYPFFGEFNEATAQGVIVAKAPGSEAPAPEAESAEPAAGPAPAAQE